MTTAPPRTLAAVAYLVREYDEAIRFFVDALGFELVEDTRIDDAKRWVRVRPQGAETSLLLARAAKPEQLAAVGNQGGGRVTFFLHTDDFSRDYERLVAHGVRFAESPREEPFGRVVVFHDLYGNKWDLIERR